MPIELKMPALSPTMEEGTLAKWYVREGDEVHSGDILAEIETDKATMEFEAVDEGTLGKILVPEGTEGVKVNQPIALLLEEGWSFAGIGAEIAALVMEHAFDYLDAPVKRVAGKDVPLPYAANLERLALPQSAEVVEAAKAVSYR